MTATRDDRSLGELFADLSQQTSTLVKKEIELARHEITRSASTIARDAAFAAVGGALAYAGLIVLLIAAGWLLVEAGLPVWASFALVGAVAVASGAFLAIRYGRHIPRVNVVPQRTVETVKDDVEWAKEQTK